MHTVQARGILSADNTMNVYRGCTHGCIYCDSRSRCYRIRHDFEDVEVKENAAERLSVELAGRRERVMVHTGSMCDPYLPLEAQTRLSRRCAEVILQRGCALSVLTKSPLILRDLDVLCELAQRTRCVAQMTLTTWDPALCRMLEPNVADTQARLETLCRLREAGIETAVWLCPILPYINDTMDNLMALLRGCEEVGVKHIFCFGMGLTLREGSREYYYAQLDRLFPGLRARYAKRYGLAYEIPSDNAGQLMRAFLDFGAGHGICTDIRENFAWCRRSAREGRQLSLFNFGSSDRA